MSRSNNDYLNDPNASKYILCEQIMDYYRKRGQHHKVKVWVEQEELSSGRRIAVVRSNISFSVKKFAGV